MRPKTITPYQRLLTQALELLYPVFYPRRISMWRYPKEKLGDKWPIAELYERTKAADQLGFDVLLIAGDDGLSVEYQKRVKKPSWGPFAHGFWPCVMPGFHPTPAPVFVRDSASAAWTGSGHSGHRRRVS